MVGCSLAHLEGLGFTVAKEASFTLGFPEPSAAESAAGAAAQLVAGEGATFAHPEATAPSADGETLFMQALGDAFSSALTKFDSLETYFAAGRTPVDLGEMLVKELQQDGDLLPFLQSAEHAEALRPFARSAVGRRFGEWKKGATGGERKVTKARKEQAAPLPWSSIDAYPEWVMDKINTYSLAEPAEREAARRHLEDTLLLGGKSAVLAASIKYDGTCFGKTGNSELVGRRVVLGEQCAKYVHTSTAPAKCCDVAALRRSLVEICGAEIERLCVWGELMCNPNVYRYTERGLANRWICFGVVAAVDVAGSSTIGAEISRRLAQQDLAHSLSPSGSLMRLMLCPALRQLLVDVAGCDAAESPFEGLSHAEVVSRAAASLRSGENEGLVLVLGRPGGQASLRKWKNSSEGASARKSEAQLLRACHSLCVNLAVEGRLDHRIVEMVDTLRSVADAETNPSGKKKGRGGVAT